MMNTVTGGAWPSGSHSKDGEVSTPGGLVDRSGMDEEARRSLASELARHVRGAVSFDGATRGIYSTDS